MFLDAPGTDDDGAAAVSVVATATRNAPLDALPARLAPAIAWLAGATLALKKVDSLLRGNTSAEVAYVARASAGAAPASLAAAGMVCAATRVRAPSATSTTSQRWRGS